MGQSKIKICGLSRDIDIQYVNDISPEFVGFVFAKSKRQVTPVQVSDLREKLKPEIQTVGVFVNETTETILSIAKRCSLDIIQLHGDETQKDIDALRQQNLIVWRALRVQGKGDIQRAQDIDADRLLLDTYVSGEYGGSGKQFDLTFLETCSSQWIAEKIILAGGLHPENIANILKEVQPYAVDVSSGVESDGYKDARKIQAFYQAVRQ